MVKVRIVSGVVVAPQPMAAEVGVETLERGGNAFDAAVAAASMQAAVDPFMCGIGGYGIVHVHTASNNECQIVDFYGTAGSKVSESMWADRLRQTSKGDVYVEGLPNEIGYAASTVPATVAGLAEIHRRWGSLSWRTLLQPAISALRDGYPTPAYVEDYYRYPFAARRPAFADWLAANPAMKSLWFNEAGALRRTGDLWRNSDYAETLTTIAADGADAFYTGSVADRIVTDMTANGGCITAKDLADYRPLIRPLLETTYRGYQVYSSPPPAISMLNVLEHFDLRRLEHGSMEHLALLARAMEWAYANQALLGDPAFVDNPVDRLLDPETARAAIRAIRMAQSPALAQHPVDSGTTHLTVRDRAGNIAAITHSLGSGSGVVTPGLGFQYNGAVDAFDPRPGRPGSLQPGKGERRAHSPTIVMSDGRPFMALGSPGGQKIITAVLQVMLNVIDYAMTPVEAVSASRIHAQSGRSLAEARIRRSVLEELRALGFEVTLAPHGYDTIQGRVQLIMVHRSTRLSAGDAYMA